MRVSPIPPRESQRQLVSLRPRGVAVQLLDPIIVDDVGAIVGIQSGDDECHFCGEAMGG